MEKVIFLGNGLLAEVVLRELSQKFEVVFHAHTKEDLGRVVELKREYPEAHAVLASFGVMVPSSVLEVFEPEGILNIHPSLLPSYRGASPIESAILAGDVDFSVSVMKLAKAMDAGPIYYQTTLTSAEIASEAGTELVSGIIPKKEAIYEVLATTGAKWISEHIGNLPEASVQDDSKATFCGKLDKSMSLLTPKTDTAEQTLRKIVAYQGFPKPKYTFYGLPCIILEAHIVKQGETALIPMACADGAVISVDRLQPEGRKAMDAKAFLNGYKK